MSRGKQEVLLASELEIAQCAQRLVELCEKDGINQGLGIAAMEWIVTEAKDSGLYRSTKIKVSLSESDATTH